MPWARRWLIPAASTSPGTMRIPPPTPNSPARKPASTPTTTMGHARMASVAEAAGRRSRRHAGTRLRSRPTLAPVGQRPRRGVYRMSVPSAATTNQTSPVPWPLVSPGALVAGERVQGVVAGRELLPVDDGAGGQRIGARAPAHVAQRPSVSSVKAYSVIPASSTRIVPRSVSAVAMLTSVRPPVAGVAAGVDVVEAAVGAVVGRSRRGRRGGRRRPARCRWAPRCSACRRRRHRRRRAGDGECEAGDEQPPAPA